MKRILLLPCLITTIGLAQNYSAGTGAGTGGSGNTNVGISAAASATGNGNVAIGAEAGKINEGDANVFVGSKAGVKNTEGYYNTFVGFQSAFENTVGYQNSFFGNAAGRNNTSGIRNTFMGIDSGFSNTTGSNNSFYGIYSGEDVTSGSLNLCLGYKSGDNLQTGGNNVFIGRVGVADPAISNTIILATGGGTHRLHIDSAGNAGLGLPNNPGSLGNRLVIRKESNNNLTGNSGLSFVNLTSAYNVAPTLKASKFLTVDNTGKVVLMNMETIPPGTDVDTSIYLNDGSLENTTNNVRTVEMLENDLYFKSPDSTNYGRIYIGKHFTNSSYPIIDGLNEEYKLFVETGILTERIKVALRDANEWSDYVFADDYALKPLSEVEAFVKENKHLPGIASAKELEKTGIDLGQMQAKQMEKIEELTLYAIEQNKMLEKQSKEIEELKAQMKMLLETK